MGRYLEVGRGQGSVGLIIEDRLLCPDPLAGKRIQPCLAPWGVVWPLPIWLVSLAVSRQRYSWVFPRQWGAFLLGICVLGQPSQTPQTDPTCCSGGQNVPHLSRPYGWTRSRSGSRHPGQVLGLHVSQRDPRSVADPARAPALPRSTSPPAAATKPQRAGSRALDMSPVLPGH